MKLKRNIITPLVTLLFAVIALTGILMFLHILDGYTEVLHELLGVVFIIFSILHIIINWKALKNHLKSDKFGIAIVITIILSLGIVLAGKGHGDHERFILNKLITANINSTLSILEIDYQDAVLILKNENITIGNATTIQEIGINNNIAPKDVIELIAK